MKHEPPFCHVEKPWYCEGCDCDLDKQIGLPCYLLAGADFMDAWERGEVSWEDIKDGEQVFFHRTENSDWIGTVDRVDFDNYELFLKNLCAIS